MKHNSDDASDPGLTADKTRHCHQTHTLQYKECDFDH